MLRLKRPKDCLFDLGSFLLGHESLVDFFHSGPLKDFKGTYNTNRIGPLYNNHE